MNRHHQELGQIPSLETLPTLPYQDSKKLLQGTGQIGALKRDLEEPD